MAYRVNLPPLGSKTLALLEEKFAKGDVLTDEELLGYEEKMLFELENAQKEAEKTDDTSDWYHFLNTHDMRVGDSFSCVIMTNVPSFCREKPYDWEVELKDAMNAALSKNFHKEDGTSSKEDDFVKSVIVDSPATLFVMKTQEDAQAAIGLGSIPFKGVNLNVCTDGSYPVWDYLTDEDED